MAARPWMDDGASQHCCSATRLLALRIGGTTAGAARGWSAARARAGACASSRSSGPRRPYAACRDAAGQNDASHGRLDAHHDHK